MNISNTIPKSLISAVITILSPFIKDLTPTNLVNALQQYSSEKSETATSPQRPYKVSELQKMLQLSKPSIFKLIRTGKLTVSIRRIHDGVV